MTINLDINHRLHRTNISASDNLFHTLLLSVKTLQKKSVGPCWFFKLPPECRIILCRCRWDFSSGGAMGSAPQGLTSTTGPHQPPVSGHLKQQKWGAGKVLVNLSPMNLPVKNFYSISHVESSCSRAIFPLNTSCCQQLVGGGERCCLSALL